MDGRGERQGEVGERSGTVHDPQLSVVVVRIDAGRYAFRLEDVVEVQRMVAVLPLPDAPPVVEGIIDVRGRIVPVLDVRSRFGHPPRRPSPGDRLVLARAGGRDVALRVDDVLGIQTIDHGDIDTSVVDLPGVGRVAGVIRAMDGLVVIHDLATFLSSSEGEELEAALDARSLA